jgi:very-short-patch-repair endonuclease/transcription elongation GreA/GreB family factor
MQMHGLGATKSRLRNLLRYTDELLSFNEKVAFDLAREPYPHFHEFQVASLEGVDAALDDETWLRIHRLRETRPPDCDPIFDGWVDFGLHSAADQPPQLAAERVLRLPIEEISDLVEAGLLPDAGDVMRPVGTDDSFPDHMDVILRLRNLPEFQSIWQNYAENKWNAWAEIERPRRRSIEFYNKIYQIHQRLIALGDDTPIELVFGVGVARWMAQGTRLNVPIIEQLIEIELQEDGSLDIRPRQTAPQLTLKAFHVLEVEGSKAVQQDIGQQLERTVEDADVGFSPFDRRTFEKILRACAARLSSTGIYHPDTLTDPLDRGLPDADTFLRLTDTWVLYVRQRSGDFRREDIARLINRVDEVESEEELPAPAVSFVVEPSDEVLYPADYDELDLSSRDLILPEQQAGTRPAGSNAGAGSQGSQTSADRGADTFFFPLPFNDDQVEIIRRLESKDSTGLVVQGPPGTGKTHTIANIICHFLATRRRVLVTAKTPEALRALQEKIPEGIRDLAISVIHNDREGARQLQHAVQVLADEAKSIDVRLVTDQIRNHHARLAELGRQVELIDGQLHRIAERNLARVPYGDAIISPMELARAVAEQATQHGWFPDKLTLDQRHDPKFTGAEIDEARGLRRLLSSDLRYDIATLPSPDALPALARVVAAHGELGRVLEIEAASRSGQIPYMKPDLDAAQRLRDWVVGFDAFMGEVRKEPWLLDIYHALLGRKPVEPAPLTALNQALLAWVEFHRQGQEYELLALGCDHTADLALDRAIGELAAGRKPFGVFSVFRGGLKAKIDNIRVEGRSPSTPAEWVVVRSYREWQQEGHRFVGRWTGIARGFGAPGLPTEWQAARSELLRLGRLIERLHGFHRDVDVYRQAIKDLFPYGVEPESLLVNGECQHVIDALNTNLEKADLTVATELRQRLLEIAERADLPFHTALADFCQKLGNPEVSQGSIVEGYQEIVAEAQRLDDLRDAFSRLDEITTLIARCGAPHWADRLRNDLGVGNDRWTPSTWRSAWEWSRADGYLRSLVDREGLRTLSDARVVAETEQQRLFAEVVRLRTFLGMKSSLTQRVQAALASFTAAIARLGRGTGKTAGRFRRIIREAAFEAAQAVPCWILPEWRVAEQLPAELGAFDLVIIDEASQSDITALPAILRGMKVLIVGDDKQVSPSAIGIEDRKIVQLRMTFLTGLPFANHMDPATSLYELAGMIYLGRAIILREHFRCVEPIISFSSRFYPKPLIPLRLPTASERLDPPLVDIYVPFGRKVRDVNEAEADVAVQEITKIVGDAYFAGRSIGVISLIGNTQANRIYSRLITELGTETIEKHRIMCGNAATFQGQERDIVFLSMVACPDTAVSQTSRIYEQRFNVAASRARDRLVLVRSVAASDLKPGDLKLALIEHFRTPMKANMIRPKEVLELCQSDFERDFGRRLLDLGYRIRPQVPVGGYAIDFVVEGADDRRLAIELDGDKYHGPDRWADDTRRQRALERLGWTFWRCWGSTWIADREGCLADLVDVLQRLGIDPVGMTEVEGVFTEHIEVPNPAAPSRAYDKVELNEPVAVQSERSPEMVERQEGVPLRPRVVQQAADAIPELPFVEPVLSVPTEEPAAARTSVFADLDAVVVEVGDLVFIRYDNEPERTFSVRLSDTINNPDEGTVHVDRAPLGAAILGASADEQVTVRIGNQTRTAVIEKIEKARDALLAAE